MAPRQIHLAKTWLPPWHSSVRCLQWLPSTCSIKSKLLHWCLSPTSLFWELLTPAGMAPHSSLLSSCLLHFGLEILPWPLLLSFHSAQPHHAPPPRSQPHHLPRPHHPRNAEHFSLYHIREWMLCCSACILGLDCNLSFCGHSPASLSLWA